MIEIVILKINNKIVSIFDRVELHLASDQFFVMCIALKQNMHCEQHFFNQYIYKHSFNS